jgi:hypothetical protein
MPLSGAAWLGAYGRKSIARPGPRPCERHGLGLATSQEKLGERLKTGSSRNPQLGQKHGNPTLAPKPARLTTSPVRTQVCCRWLRRRPRTCESTVRETMCRTTVCLYRAPSSWSAASDIPITSMVVLLFCGAIRGLVATSPLERPASHPCYGSTGQRTTDGPCVC